MTKPIPDHIRTIRDRLLGVWAAHELGFGVGGALVYAGEITAMDMERGEGAMIAKICSDFSANRLGIGREAVEDRLQRCQSKAEEAPLTDQGTPPVCD